MAAVSGTSQTSTKGRSTAQLQADAERLKAELQAKTTAAAAAAAAVALPPAGSHKRPPPAEPVSDAPEADDASESMAEDGDAPPANGAELLAPPADPLLPQEIYVSADQAKRILDSLENGLADDVHKLKETDEEAEKKKKAARNEAAKKARDKAKLVEDTVSKVLERIPKSDKPAGPAARKCAARRRFRLRDLKLFHDVRVRRVQSTLDAHLDS